MEFIGGAAIFLVGFVVGTVVSLWLPIHFGIRSRDAKARKLRNSP